MQISVFEKSNSLTIDQFQQQPEKPFHIHIPAHFWNRFANILNGFNIAILFVSHRIRAKFESMRNQPSFADAREKIKVNRFLVSGQNAKNEKTALKIELTIHFALCLFAVSRTGEARLETDGDGGPSKPQRRA